jgi:hypothetical protein
MADSIVSPFPRIEIAGELYCPHCGSRLFSWEDGVPSKCPHLVFGYGWGDPDLFLAVRASYARALVCALLESPAYHSGVLENEREPISEEDQLAICEANFSPGDRLSSLLASYCSGFIEDQFPELLSRSTIVFADDRSHSGVHIAVDLPELDP